MGLPVLNFNEIPQANIAGGQQDTFELFTRDFLEFLGFEIEEGPDRGQDGGRDIIVKEKRLGIIGTTEVRWLVSCKHKAHSGTAVNDNDEQNISDRMQQHNATGFLGVYSTVISSPLGRRLQSLKQNIEVMTFDHERIETALLIEDPRAQLILRRYFPVSFGEWESIRHIPANIFETYEPLQCNLCGKDLLTEESMQMAIIVFVEDPDFAETHNYDKTYIKEIYFACKGACDESLEHKYMSSGFITSWKDISDIMIPTVYLNWIMGVLNRIRITEYVYSDIAFETLKQFILRVSQYVVRENTSAAAARLRVLADIPDYI